MSVGTPSVAIGQKRRAERKEESDATNGGASAKWPGSGCVCLFIIHEHRSLCLRLLLLPRARRQPICCLVGARGSGLHILDVFLSHLLCSSRLRLLLLIKTVLDRITWPPCFRVIVSFLFAVSCIFPPRLLSPSPLAHHSADFSNSSNAASRQTCPHPLCQNPLHALLLSCPLTCTCFSS